MKNTLNTSDTMQIYKHVKIKQHRWRSISTCQSQSQHTGMAKFVKLHLQFIQDGDRRPNCAIITPNI